MKRPSLEHIETRSFRENFRIFHCERADIKGSNSQRINLTRTKSFRNDFAPTGCKVSTRIRVENSFKTSWTSFMWLSRETISKHSHWFVCSRIIDNVSLRKRSWSFFLSKLNRQCYGRQLNEPYVSHCSLKAFHGTWFHRRKISWKKFAFILAVIAKLKPLLQTRFWTSLGSGLRCNRCWLIYVLVPLSFYISPLQPCYIFWVFYFHYSSAKGLCCVNQQQ